MPVLIEAGADVNHVDSMGHTALMWAVRFAHSEFVPVLIEAGADVNHVDSMGTPCSHVGSEVCSFAVCVCVN